MVECNRLIGATEAYLIQVLAHKMGTLVVWTVCWDRPGDPARATARPSFIGPMEGREGDGPHLSRSLLFAETLEELAELLPPGLTFLPRSPEDEAGVWGTWV